MTNTIHQHLPAYVTGRAAVSVTYETTDQLLAIEWVARWATPPEFHRFSASQDGKLLMAEFAEGKKWFVVGRFENPENRLPVFELKKDDTPWYAPAGTGAALRDYVDSLEIQYPDANGNYLADKEP